MTQYQLSPGASPNTNLVVTAFQVIGNLGITGPSSPQQAGAALTCTYTYLNSGGDGTTIFTLKDQLGATLATQTLTTPAGSGSSSMNFTMPVQDTTLTLTSNYGGSATRLIKVLKLVNTTITLTLTPTSPKVNDPVTASGVLSRNDNPANYSGVSGVTVQLLDSNNAVVASATTNSTGVYSIPFTAPATAGTYVYHAYFAGSGILASALSRSRAINFGALSPLVPILALSAATIYAIFA